MLENYIRLLFGFILGGTTTILNVTTFVISKKPLNFVIKEIPLLSISKDMVASISIYEGITSMFFGGVTAIFTCVYLYFQTKKIITSNKEKKKNERDNQAVG